MHLKLVYSFSPAMTNLCCTEQQLFSVKNEHYQRLRGVKHGRQECYKTEGVVTIGKEPTEQREEGCWQLNPTPSPEYRQTWSMMVKNGSETSQRKLQGLKVDLPILIK